MFDELSGGQVCPADRLVYNPAISASDNRFTIGQGYDYDAAGNLTKDATGRRFTYDAENKQIVFRDGSNAVIGQYFYDGDGKRVKKVAPETENGQTMIVETVFVYDAFGKLVAEYSNKMSGSAKTSYLTQDTLGSPRVITNQSGAVISRRDFLPFGEELVTPYYRTQSFGYPIETDKVRQKFTAYERDSETELDYAQARYYNKNYGRFYSVDPVGSDFNNPQTLNKYRYALNNPLRYTDKDGNYEEDVHYMLTRSLAYAAGFSMQDSTSIASWNQYVDDNPNTSPMELLPYGPAVEKRALYHFTTQEGRMDLFNDTFSEIKTLWQTEAGSWDEINQRSKVFEKAGMYFHAFQDAYSHFGYEPRAGHSFMLHIPDKTYNNVPLADQMARETFGSLRGLFRVMNFPKSNQVTSLVGFKSISGFVHRFNEARTLNKKADILDSMIGFITLQRKLSKSNAGNSIETSETKIQTTLTFR